MAVIAAASAVSCTRLAVLPAALLSLLFLGASVVAPFPHLSPPFSPSAATRAATIGVALAMRVATPIALLAVSLSGAFRSGPNRSDGSRYQPLDREASALNPSQPSHERIELIRIHRFPPLATGDQEIETHQNERTRSSGMTGSHTGHVT
jgi:hypothetical protein